MSTITNVNPSALQIIKEKAFAILKQRYPEAWKETLEATVNESLVLLATDDYSGRVIDGGRGESLFSWSVETVAPGSVLQTGDAYKIVDTPDGLDLVLIPTPMDDLIRRMASEPGGLDIKSHEDNESGTLPMVTIHTVDELVAEAAQHLPGYDNGAHEDCEGIVVDRLTFQLIDEDTCLAILRKSADKESDLLFRFTSHIVRPDAVVGSIFSLIYSNGKVSVNCILQPMQDSLSALSEIKHHWIRKHVLGARLPAEFRAKINNADRSITPSNTHREVMEREGLGGSNRPPVPDSEEPAEPTPPIIPYLVKNEEELFNIADRYVAQLKPEVEENHRMQLIRESVRVVVDGDVIRAALMQFGEVDSYLFRVAKNSPILTKTLHTVNLDKPSADSSKKYPADPMDLKTGKFTPKEILFHKNGFVIARGPWEKDTLDSVACRWHVPGEIGYPNGFGRPQWMLLGNVKPEHVTPTDNPILKGSVNILFREKSEDLKVGQWVKTASDWHLVVYVYGDGNDTVSACGLGKWGSYPIAISDIVDVAEGPTAMGLWFREHLGGKLGLWLDPMGRPTVSFYMLPDMLWGKANNGNVYGKVTYSPSLASGKWICSDIEEACFDYMLGRHVLIGTIEPEYAIEDMNAEIMKYDFSKIRKRLEQAVGSYNLDKLWELYTHRKEDLKQYSRVFNEDLSSEVLNTVFNKDVNFGANYYDFRSLKK